MNCLAEAAVKFSPFRKAGFTPRSRSWCLAGMNWLEAPPRSEPRRPAGMGAMVELELELVPCLIGEAAAL